MDWSKSELKELTKPPCTYPKNIWTLDENELDEHLPLDNGWHKISPSTDLGKLDRLPLELLTNVLLQVDLQCLTDFRRINKRAMQIVDSIPQYDTIVQHAPNSLRAILAVQKGRKITCQDLYDKLCMGRCETCGEFGGFLYLTSFRRACMSCFRMAPDCFSMYSSTVRHKFPSKPSDLKDVDQILALPGCYSPLIRNSRGRRKLYDFNSLMNVQLDKARNNEADTAELRSGLQEARTFWKWHTAKDEVPVASYRNVPWLDSLKGEKYAFLNQPQRYMTTIWFPHLDPFTRKVERGFRCSGCVWAPKRGPRDPQYNNREFYHEWARESRMFNLETFKEHFKVCPNIGCKKKPFIDHML